MDRMRLRYLRNKEIHVYTNRSYKPLSFVADGDGYRAKVVNGDTLLLQLNNKNNEIEWFSDKVLGQCMRGKVLEKIYQNLSQEDPSLQAGDELACFRETALFFLQAFRGFPDFTYFRLCASVFCDCTYCLIVSIVTPPVVAT